MASDPTEVHAETDAARAGSTPNIVRWVLAISLLAAIVLLSIIWITGAATQSDAEENANVSAQIADQQDRGDDTDSIVGENADRIEDAPAAGETAPSGDATIAN